MEQGMLHLHSLLRWIIILLLLVTIVQAFGKKPGLRKSSLWLLISAHIMFVVGLYHLLLGRWGMLKVKIPAGVDVWEDRFLRFFWLEHPLMMFIAIALITVARGKAKILNYKSAGWLLLVALILILAAVPWPFREIIGRGRAWFPGM